MILIYFVAVALFVGFAVGVCVVRGRDSRHIRLTNIGFGVWLADRWYSTRDGLWVDKRDVSGLSMSTAVVYDIYIKQSRFD